MTARAWLVLAIVCACAPREGKLYELPARRPSAEDVVANMAATYRSALTYEDRGTVTLEGDHRQPFRTAFVRGGQFRIQLDGGSTHDENVALVPEMLMPVHPRPGLRDVKLGPDEKIAGHTCWHVIAEHPTDGHWELWIDQDTHLVRRFAHHHAVIDYEPTINAPIPASAFEPKVERPSWLGVRTDPKSARLLQIVAGSPADRGGLHVDDEVTSIDGKPIAVGADIVRVARSLAPGRKVPVVVRRDGRELALTVTTEPMPAPDQMIGSSLRDRPAPDFSIDKVGGGKLALHDFKGKVVVLEYWATWCGPCRVTAPELAAWHRKYPDIEVIGISDEDLPTIEKAVAERKLDYTIAHDPDDKAWNAYLVQALPTMFVIDKAGIVRYAGIGAGDFDTIEALITKLR